MLTATKIRKELGCGKNTVLRLIANGDLPAINISSSPGRATWRIREEDFKAFLDRRSKSPEPEQEEQPRRRRPFDERLAAATR